MLKKLCSKFFCKRFYPTNRINWYHKKGYVGNDDQEIFVDFIRSQSRKDGIFYKCFLGLELRRFKVQSGRDFLDCVELFPKPENSMGNSIKSLFIKSEVAPGSGQVFILFQGRREYYEARYRDMAMLSHATGAKVIGFNPKGFHSSTGKTKILTDIVDDGVALVRHILKQGYKPENIVMLGNSLGAAVQEMVCQRLMKVDVSGFRQINSNSFRSLAAVVSTRAGVSYLEGVISKVLRYSGWEINVPDSFYTVGSHRIHLRRYQDRTILEEAEYHSKIDIEECIKDIPDKYQEQLAWVIGHNQLKLCKTKTKSGDKSHERDPHNLGLHKFVVKKIETDSEDFGIVSVYDLINRYLECSNKPF